MFDNFLIVPNSLKNDLDANGNAVGFQFAVRIADYMISKRSELTETQPEPAPGK